MTESLTNRILSLIASRPGIRLVEIADILDIDPEQIEPSIRHTFGKTIRIEQIKAPNGRQADSYTMDPDFAKTWLEDHPLPKNERERPAPRPLRAPSSGEPKPIPKPQSPPSKTKVEIAIEYLQQHGPTLGMVLKGVLNIGPKHHVSTYLGGAVTRHLMVTDGKSYWLPGQKPPVTPDIEKPLPKQPSVPEILDGKGGAEQQQDAPLSGPSAPTPGAEETADLFRCAIWSNGQFELALGDTAITLNRAQTRRMVAYLERMSEPEAA